MKNQDERQSRWVDYLEGELDPALKADYDKLESSSREDAKLIKDLKDLKSSLKKTDPFPLSQDFNEKLMKEIMADVSSTHMLPKWQLKLMQPQTWTSVAAAVVAVVGVTLLSDALKKPSVQITQQTGAASDMLMEVSQENPNLLAKAVGVHSNEEDFVIEALAHRMEAMTDTEIQDLFDSLSE